MHRPVITVTSAYIAGLLLGQGSLYFPYTAAILVIIGIVSAAILVVLHRLTLSRALLYAVPALIGSFALLSSTLWLSANHYTRIIPEDRSVHRLTGKVLSALERDPDRTAFVLDVHAIDGRNVSGKVRVTIRETVNSIGYGDFVSIEGKLFRPGGFWNPAVFDYPAYLARSGVYRILSVKNGDNVRMLSDGGGIFRTIQDWRERIRQAFLTSVSGPGSAILQAMVLGEEGHLTDEMRDQFLAAGVTHIISISGSHLGMMAIICFGFIRMLMRLLPDNRYQRLTLHADPNKIAAWLTLPLVIFYTLLAGGQTATVRSLVMICAAMAALILDREQALLHSLALAALLLLVIHPQALFDISFQLSFLSVFTIGSAVQLWNRVSVRPRGQMAGFARQAALLVLITLVAGLATGPLVARYFNQISLAGLLSNIIVVPFAGMAVVPLGLVSGILSLFTGDLPLAGLNQFTADLFLRSVRFFADLPIAEFHPRSPGVLWLGAYAVFLAALFMVIRNRLLLKLEPFVSSSRPPRGPIVAGALSVLALVLLTVPFLLPRSAAVISFPDVGQGDSTLIQLPGNRNILIDGGGTADGRFDTGRRILAPFLWNSGVDRLDLLVLSHPHPDHMNGLKFIVDKFGVGRVWTHGHDTGLPGYDGFSEAVKGRQLEHSIVKAGDDALMLGEAEVSVLHPGPSFRSRERRAYAQENDRSLVLRIAYRGRVLLFTGDIGANAERWLLGQGAVTKCDLLKVPHHGSKSSSSDLFVAAIRPSVAVMTIGRGNRYHHPSPEVVERYERSGSRIWRTDRDGALFITIDDAGMSGVSWSERMLRRMDPDGPPALVQERENWKRVWLRKWAL